jgi:hypothetical protein
MSDLIKQLRDGCINHPKRWSGDTCNDLGGIVDEIASDELMSQAADEIQRLQTDLEKIKTWYNKSSFELDNIMCEINNNDDTPMPTSVDFMKMLDKHKRKINDYMTGVSNND